MDSTVCPYFGLAQDPETPSLYPRNDAICRLNLAPRPTIDWQSRFCVATRHTACTYFRAQAVDPIQPIRKELAPSRDSGAKQVWKLEPRPQPENAPEPAQKRRRDRARYRIAAVAIASNLVFVLVYAGLVYWMTRDVPAGNDTQAAIAATEEPTPTPTVIPEVVIAPTQAPVSVTPTAEIAPTPTEAPAPAQVLPTATPSPQPAPTAQPTATPAPAATPEATPRAESAWQPTHRVANFGAPVNLRGGPATTFSRVLLLTPGTLLQSLGEVSSGVDGIWLGVKTEDGDEGWIRTIDVVALSP